MKEQLSSWKELMFSSLQSFTNAISQALPAILGAILMLLIGWIVAKSLAFVVRKLLRRVKFDSLAEKPPFAEYLDKASVKTKPSEIVGKFVYWTIYLLFIVTAAETLGLQIVSAEISKLIAYLPQLFSALVIFIIGIYLITFVREFIRAATASMGMSAGKFISAFVFYMLLIMLTLTTLEQAGINISIITANLNLILGAILLSFSISYGFASRDILTNILSSFFSKRVFEIGQIIEMGDLKGEIIEIGTVYIRIKTENEEVIVPTQQLLNNQVKILKK